MQSTRLFLLALPVACLAGCQLWRAESVRDELEASAKTPVEMSAKSASNSAVSSLYLEDLDSADPKMQVAALQKAAVQRSRQALPATIRASQHHELEVRLAAIAALGAIGGSDAIVALRELAKREGEVPQAAAVSELGRLHDWPAVHRAADDKSWRVRRAAAAALAADTSPAARELAHRLLADRSSSVQLQQVESIALWPLTAAGPLLLAGLEAPSYATRAAALAALANRWPPAQSLAVADLQPLVPPRQKIDELRQTWLVEFGSESIPPREPPPPDTAIAAQPTGDAASVEPEAACDVAMLEERLRSLDKQERLQAAVALSRLGASSGTAVLEGLTFDPDFQVRRAAAVAIGTLDDPLFLPVLMRLLDAEPAVRLAALNSLTRTVGRDVARDDAALSLTAAQRVERWKEWYLAGGDRRR